jgi:hypothetical protein
MYIYIYICEEYHKSHPEQAQVLKLVPDAVQALLQAQLQAHMQALCRRRCAALRLGAEALRS